MGTNSRRCTVAKRDDTPNYDPDLHPRQAEMLCERGAVDREIAEFFGIQPSTFYYWRNRYPEFAAAMQVGKEIADDRVERSLYNRAVGYSYDSEKIVTVSVGDGGGSVVERVPIVEHVPPDAKSAIRWLEARRPKVWRRSLALTGAEGGAIELKDSDKDFSNLKPDERNQLRDLLTKQIQASDSANAQSR